MKSSLARRLLLGGVAVALPATATFATPTTIFSDDFNSGLSSDWVDLTLAKSWTGKAAGVSGFVQKDGGISTSDNTEANSGYGATKTSMFQNIDYQFDTPVDRSAGDTTITINFKAKWESGSLSGEGSRLVVTYVHDYPTGGLDVADPSKITNHSSQWWARPAYNMRIRTQTNDALIMYGGGPEVEGEFEIDGNGYWLPGFSSAPGGSSPQSFVNGVEGAGTGNYSQSTFKDYSYILKPDRQELWYDGNLVGTQILGDITNPANDFDINGWRKQFDTIEGVRFFWRASNGTAQAIIDDVEIIVDAPASLLDDLYWDPDTSTTDIQGGTGTWSAAGTTFWNGNTNVSFSNDPAERVVFNTANGTVTLNTDVTADEIAIESNNYTFTTSSARTFTSDVTTFVDSKLTKTGSGVLTIVGNITNDGQLEFNTQSNNGIVLQGDLTGGEVRFEGNGVSNYAASNADKGIQFDGGGTRTLASDLTATNFNRDIVIGARNSTTVNYSGLIKADQSNDVIMVLDNGGKFVFGSGAEFDLINGSDEELNSFFTRQVWVDSDGTGVIEFASDFVADQVDLTPGSEVAKGLGSVRLSNAELVTNSTQSIPGHKRRLADGVTPGWNGHIVFEDTAGGKWTVQTNDQTNESAVWGRTDFTINTVTNLEHTGTTQPQVGGYTAYNAFQIQDGSTMTKTGAGNLIFTGEQAYETGATMIVEEGGVIFNSNPTAGTGQNFTNGQNLNLQLTQTGSATANTSLVEIKSASVADSANLTIASGANLDVTDGITQTGGSINGNGTITGNVNASAGSLDPGSSAGLLTIDGNLSLASGTTLNIELAGTGTAGVDYDQLAVTGNAGLAGTLAVTELLGFTALPGDSFTVLTGTTSGSFNAITGTDPGVAGYAGLWLDVVVNPNDVTLVADALDGDANLDGTVNIGDLTLLAGNFGGTSNWLGGDFNDDGDVNIGDLTLLAGQFGNSIAPVAVPEPMSLCLLAVGGLTLLRRRKN